MTAGRRRMTKVSGGAGAVAVGFGVTAVLGALLVGAANMPTGPVQSLGIAAPRAQQELTEVGGVTPKPATTSHHEFRLSATSQTARASSAPTPPEAPHTDTGRPTPPAPQKTPTHAAPVRPLGDVSLTQLAGHVQQ